MVKATGSLLPVQQGHLASLEDGLDFVNTYHLAGAHRRVRQVHEHEHDHLDSPATALEWFAGHDLVHSSARDQLLERYQADPQEGEQMLARLRRLRAAMRGVLVSAVERRSPDLADLAEINRAMRTHYIYELVPAQDGISVEHRHQGDPVDGAMSRLAESVAREMIQGMPGRLRICDNPTCREVFSDNSRTGRKRWCDMSTCGNRAKVARHRARLRAVMGGSSLPEVL
jgi:predicted RNA-binding Zn ribbon-like protein